MANTTTNGSGRAAEKAPDAEGELASVLAALREDIGALKSDITALKADGAGLGPAALHTAEAAITTAKDKTVHTVKTVEEDLADVVTDITTTVQRNPYTTIGVAVLGGMLLTSLLRKD